MANIALPRKALPRILHRQLRIREMPCVWGLTTACYIRVETDAGVDRRGIICESLVEREKKLGLMFSGRTLGS